MFGFNPFSLEGKTILVTGASSGIGRGIAVTCSKMGATVILNGRNLMKLGASLALLEEGDHTMIAADLTNGESMSGMVSQLLALDGIVHCAGIGQRVLCKMATDHDVDSVSDIQDSIFKLPRLDVNDFPKDSKAEPNKWYEIG